MVKQALIVFVKEPIDGQVKTRLTPTLSMEEAAQVYRAFVSDTFQQYKKLLPNTELLYYSNKEAFLLRKIIPEQKKWFLQKGENLGEKMHNALKEELKKYSKCLLIGSDHPNLPLSYLKKAFRVLSYTDGVIGPSIDGGYYCIGLRNICVELFDSVKWSTASVWKQTMENIKKQKLDFFTLPQWYDVDTVDDLKKFITEVNLNDFPSFQKVLRALHI